MEFNPSRRLFLRRGGLAAVAPVIAPVLPIEKVIKYFFAPAGGWGDKIAFSPQDLVIGSRNSLLTPTVITREALRILKANMMFSDKFVRAYDDEFGLNLGQRKIGDTIHIRKPLRYSS